MNHSEIDVDAELQRFEAEERAKLGLNEQTDHWTDKMIDPNFTAKQRPHTTLLVGGLTMAHDFLVEGTLMAIVGGVVGGLLGGVAQTNYGAAKAGIACASSMIERSTSSTQVGSSATMWRVASMASRKLGKWHTPMTL